MCGDTRLGVIPTISPFLLPRVLPSIHTRYPKLRRQSSAQLEAASLHTLVQMVAAGIGVTLLPQLAVEAGITDGTNIRLIPLAGPASRQIALVWRRTSLRADAFAALGRALLQG